MKGDTRIGGGTPRAGGRARRNTAPARPPPRARGGRLPSVFSVAGVSRRRRQCHRAAEQVDDQVRSFGRGLA